MKAVRKAKKKKAVFTDTKLICDYCGCTGHKARVIFRNILNRAGICSACVELFMLKLLQLENDTTDKPHSQTRH